MLDVTKEWACWRAGRGKLNLAVADAVLIAEAVRSAIGPPGLSIDRPDGHRAIAVEQDGKQHTVEVYDDTMPDGLRPLIDWLAERAALDRPAGR